MWEQGLKELVHCSDGVGRDERGEVRTQRGLSMVRGGAVGNGQKITGDAKAILRSSALPQAQ